MAAPGCGTELTTRADGRDLPPAVEPSKLETLLDADAQLAAWRVVEAFSKSGLPFELHVGWSSGGGAGEPAKVTVARATRICVFARGLRIRARNLADAVNRVGITVSDAWAPTENHWEDTGITKGGVTEDDVPVPPFARTARLEVSNPAQLPDITVRVYDGRGVLRSATPGSNQPPSGIPVGGAGRIAVVSAEPVAWRVVFTLSL